MEQGHWFTSNQFEIVPGEDQQTNPGCYGQALANWLANKLTERGYTTDVFPEDWGWCVLCQHSEYMLWVGCGAMPTEDFDPDNPPTAHQLVWHVFPHIEIPLLDLRSRVRQWLGKLDLETPLQELDAELICILETEPSVRFCGEV
ncbi:hypothetical protein [Parathalassolituus penaei]|uniref:Uncharacterized protein n=1 Tax=Parathalassolituus penaei TaxID=2997323 RepID=A0A9X3EAG4_9GAMM|nr:hypothetical protein [Parathalassolituus penaei]MCY0963959.1 hypothetical protein [Parathalassolituus penaei]